MEVRIQKTLDFYRKNPDIPVTELCKTFDVPRKRLRNRIKGIPPKKGTPAKNNKFTPVKEKAFYFYIDRFNRINLAVRPLFIKNATNYILQSRTLRIEIAVDEVPCVNSN